jgi:hypothetical protein
VDEIKEPLISTDSKEFADAEKKLSEDLKNVND